MRKVKVLFVDHAPFVGGAQLCLARDLKNLDRKRFTPYLAIDRYSSFFEIYRDCNVPIFKIPFSKLKQLSIASLQNLYLGVRELKRLISKLQPDIVLANTTRVLIIAALAKKDYRLALHIRDYDCPRWLLKLLDFRIDKYFSVSKSIQKFYQLPRNKTDVVYLGSDLDKLINRVSAKKIVRMKRKFGIGENDFVVGFAGRLVDWKGPMVLIKAVASIKESNVKLILFGTGENQQGSIERQLHQFVAGRNLGKQVIFAGFTNDQPLAYRMMDLFVLASCKPEPFATGMIEAALAKVPIVATNTGGTGEFIVNEKNGLLVEPNNVDQLAKALRRFKQDKKLASKLKEKAFADAQNFIETKFIRNLETRLIQLV